MMDTEDVYIKSISTNHRWAEKNLIYAFSPWICIFYQTSMKNWVNISFIHVPRPQLNHQKPLNKLYAMECFKLILMSFHQMFCFVFAFRGRVRFFLPSDKMLIKSTWDTFAKMIMYVWWFVHIEHIYNWPFLADGLGLVEGQRFTCINHWMSNPG